MGIARHNLICVSSAVETSVGWLRVIALPDLDLVSATTGSTARPQVFPDAPGAVDRI